MGTDSRYGYIETILRSMVDLKEAAQTGADDELLETIMAYIEQNVDALASIYGDEDEPRDTTQPPRYINWTQNAVNSALAMLRISKSSCLQTDQEIMLDILKTAYYAQYKDITSPERPKSISTLQYEKYGFWSVTHDNIWQYTSHDICIDYGNDNPCMIRMCVEWDIVPKIAESINENTSDSFPSISPDYERFSEEIKKRSNGSIDLMSENGDIGVTRSQWNGWIFFEDADKPTHSRHSELSDLYRRKNDWMELDKQSEKRLIDHYGPDWRRKTTLNLSRTDLLSLFDDDDATPGDVIS